MDTKARQRGIICLELQLYKTSNRGSFYSSGKLYPLEAELQFQVLREQAKVRMTVNYPSANISLKDSFDHLSGILFENIIDMLNDCIYIFS